MTRGIFSVKKILILAITFLLVLPAYSNAQTVTFAQQPFEFYKVSAGDSFWYIAKRYGLSYQNLMKLNPNVDPMNMHKGEIIRLKATASTPGTFQEQVVRLVNAERAKRKLRALTHRADLKTVAQKKAADMINSNYFSHTSPNFGSPFTMLRTFGINYLAAGENIAKGQKTPQEVMSAWMNSSGHRANILKPDYDCIGVGLYHGAWVQMFIKSR
jgi:uncharacterized YkwD family protein